MLGPEVQGCGFCQEASQSPGLVGWRVLWQEGQW